MILTVQVLGSGALRPESGKTAGAARGDPHATRRNRLPPVLTGGVAGIGTAYALQYGFNGLGLLLDLRLLGVSREYDLEADQLGIQYA